MPARRRKPLLVALSVLGAVVLVGGVAWAFTSRRTPALSESRLATPVGAAEIGEVAVKLHEVGTIEPIVKVDVKSTLSGKVVELLVREGDTVEKGQVLALVEPDVNQAQELAGVRSQERRTTLALSEAKREYDARRRLHEEGLLSADGMKQAEAAYRQAQEDAREAGERVAIAVESGIPLREQVRPSQRVSVTSPMAGVVIDRKVEIGETITSGVSSFNAGSVLFTVADLAGMKIAVDVNEVDVGKIHVGQAVTIGVDAFPFQRFEGKVTFISPAAKAVEKVKVFEVEVMPAEERPELRPGMTANVTVKGERKDGVLTVPTEALFQRDEREVVFVLREDFASRVPEDQLPKGKGGGKVDVSPFWKDLFEQRPVEVGLASIERVEIVSGLAAGEKVALDDPAKPPATED